MCVRILDVLSQLCNLQQVEDLRSKARRPDPLRMESRSALDPTLTAVCDTSGAQDIPPDLEAKDKGELNLTRPTQ